MTMLAYLGPGAGLSAFGALIALVVAVAAALFGFVWYPVKRLIRMMKSKEDPASSEHETERV